MSTQLATNYALLDEKIAANYETLNTKISANQTARGYEIANLAATDVKQTKHLAELQTHFDKKQRADTEHFSNLYERSARNAQALSDLTERESVGVITNFLAIARLAIVHIKRIVADCKAYLASLSTSVSIVDVLLPDGTRIPSQEVTFAGEDGFEVLLSDLVISKQYGV